MIGACAHTSAASRGLQGDNCVFVGALREELVSKQKMKLVPWISLGVLAVCLVPLSSSAASAGEGGVPRFEAPSRPAKEAPVSLFNRFFGNRGIKPSLSYDETFVNEAETFFANWMNKWAEVKTEEDLGAAADLILQLLKSAENARSDIDSYGIQSDSLKDIMNRLEQNIHQLRSHAARQAGQLIKEIVSEDKHVPLREMAKKLKDPSKTNELSDSLNNYTAVFDVMKKLVKASGIETVQYGPDEADPVQSEFLEWSLEDKEELKVFLDTEIYTMITFIDPSNETEDSDLNLEPLRKFLWYVAQMILKMVGEPFEAIPRVGVTTANNQALFIPEALWDLNRLSRSLCEDLENRDKFLRKWNKLTTMMNEVGSQVYTVPGEARFFRSAASFRIFAHAKVIILLVLSRLGNCSNYAALETEIQMINNFLPDLEDLAARKAVESLVHMAESRDEILGKLNNVEVLPPAQAGEALTDYLRRIDLVPHVYEVGRFVRDLGVVLGSDNALVAKYREELDELKKEALERLHETIAHHMAMISKHRNSSDALAPHYKYQMLRWMNRMNVMLESLGNQLKPPQEQVNEPELPTGSGGGANPGTLTSGDTGENNGEPPVEPKVEPTVEPAVEPNVIDPPEVPMVPLENPTESEEEEGDKGTGEGSTGDQGKTPTGDPTASVSSDPADGQSHRTIKFLLWFVLIAAAISLMGAVGFYFLIGRAKDTPEIA